MVQANSASEFQAIVRELTGQNSDPTVFSFSNSQTSTGPSPSPISQLETAIWIGSHGAPQRQSVTEYSSVEDEYSTIFAFLSQFHDQVGRHFTD